MGKDTHKHKLVSHERLSDVDIDGTGYSEAIKGSNITDVVVRNFSAKGGNEDCIDIVRGSDYLFHHGRLEANGCRTFITIKGGVDGVVMSEIVLTGKPKWFWDISLGDHTIYGWDAGKCKEIKFNHIRHESGKPVRILVLNSEVPLWVDDYDNYKIYKVPKLLVRLLFWFRELF